MAFTDEDKIWIKSAITEGLTATNVRFDAIDGRLDKVDSRFDAIDSRLDKIDGRLDAIDSRLDKVDSRFDTIDSRLDKVDGRLATAEERLSRYVLEMRSEVILRLDGTDRRLDFMANALLNVQPLNKAILDLGSLMSQLSRGQQQSVDRNFDMETRIARLEEQVSKLLKPAA
jgi:archaellum component FlaC